MALYEFHERFNNKLCLMSAHGSVVLMESSMSAHEIADVHEIENGDFILNLILICDIVTLSTFVWLIDVIVFLDAD